MKKNEYKDLDMKNNGKGISRTQTITAHITRTRSGMNIM
jgi:hypothetical protein